MVISIRPPATFEEFHACETLQRHAWAMSNDLEVVPLHLLVTAQKNGGVLLGAFDGGRLVGFVFGFLSRSRDGRIHHYSHLLGVEPEVRSEGIGYRLKLAQRDQVLAQGLDLVTWTYDPLQSRNAHLNLHKLGAACRTYFRDYYGPLADGINAGPPSDRFGVEWWIASERVERRLAGGDQVPPTEGAFLANLPYRTARGLLAPGDLVLDAAAGTVLFEIPADYQAVKEADSVLAMEWRLATRQVFEFYFAAGHAVIDFVTDCTGGQRRGFYVLCADWTAEATR